MERTRQTNAAARRTRELEATLGTPIDSRTPRGNVRTLDGSGASFAATVYTVRCTTGTTDFVVPTRSLRLPRPETPPRFETQYSTAHASFDKNLYRKPVHVVTNAARSSANVRAGGGRECWAVLSRCSQVRALLQPDA